MFQISFTCALSSKETCLVDKPLVHINCKHVGKPVDKLKRSCLLAAGIPRKNKKKWKCNQFIDTLLENNKDVKITFFLLNGTLTHVKYSL